MWLGRILLESEVSVRSVVVPEVAAQTMSKVGLVQALLSEWNQRGCALS